MKRLFGCALVLGIVVTCMVGCKASEEVKPSEHPTKEHPAKEAPAEAAAPKDHPAH